jgi:hypothetical protein
MRIAETATTQLQQYVQRKTATPVRQVSNVSREERMQLLAHRMPARSSGTAPDTYGERAHLLSVSGTSQQSWIG